MVGGTPQLAHARLKFFRKWPIVDYAFSESGIMIGGQENLSYPQRASEAIARQDGRPSPVDALRRLRAALSDALAGGGEKRFGTHVLKGPREPDAGRASGEERRKEERRKANIPILLDTRSYQRRRDDRDHEPYRLINVEI